MSKELEELRKMVHDLEPPDRAKIHLYAYNLRSFLNSGGELAGIAFALVGQEMSDMIEEQERSERKTSGKDAG